MNGWPVGASTDRAAFYAERYNWRHAGEERMRFHRATTLAKVRPGDAVLDIGSRNGDLRTYLPKTVRYQGMDIAPQFDAAHVVVWDVANGIPFTDASFDTVFMIEVLEHVPAPYLTAQEVRRVLRPGGQWIVSVPNPYHVKELIWNVLGTPDRQGHLYSWTKQTMTRLGQMAGFQLTGHKGTYLYPPIPAPMWMLARSVAYRFVRGA